MKNINKNYIIGGIVVLLVLFGIMSYNGLTSKEEIVTEKWAQVQNVYQSRADKIGQLVKVVKGAANFEKSTLEAVINARARATSVNINPEKLDEASLQKFQSAQDGLSSALGRLMVISEQYPTLQSNQNFTELMAEVSGMENRILTERNRFNEVVKEYNLATKTFPSILFAKLFGFEKKGYFEAAKGTEKAPEINF